MSYTKDNAQHAQGFLERIMNHSQHVLDKLFWSDEVVNTEEEKLSKSVVELERLKVKINFLIIEYETLLEREPSYEINEETQRVLALETIFAKM